MLNDARRMPWFLQCCESLRSDILDRAERAKLEPWRVTGSGKLRPKGLAFLREAWTWRENTARHRDVPPFRIMNNQQLVAMAAEFEVRSQISLPPRWRPDWKQALLQGAARVLATEQEEWPQRPPKQARHLPEVARSRVDHLCKARDQEAQELDIEPSLIGSRAVYEQLVYHELENDSPHDLLMPWQMDIMRAHLVG